MLAALSACGLESNGPDLGAGRAPADGAAADDRPNLDAGDASCTCIPPVPAGYSVVAYDQKARAPCPPGYDTPHDLVESPTAAATTCSCSCNGVAQQPTCSCGSNPATFNLVFGSTSTCGGGSNTALASASPNCNNASKSYSASGGGLNYVKAIPAASCAAAGGSCQAATEVQTFPKATADEGRACVLAAGTRTCSLGACVPAPGGSYAVCVSNGTLDACPADFSVSRVVGTAVDDTRACGPAQCACAPSSVACAAPKLTLWDSSGCSSGSKTTVVADSACTFIGWGNNHTTAAADYEVPTNGNATCAFGGTFTPQGGLGLVGATRVCCR